MYYHQEHSRADISFIGIDWGSSNFRAYAVDKTGQVRQRTKAHQGVLRIKEDNFAPTLKRLLGKWFNKYPKVPILMSGMIGSRHGWQEVDFIECPAVCEDLSEAVEKVANHRFDRDIYIVPGLMLERAKD
jgi:2-dehydro-3-deoxygalactonokinase